MDEPGRAPNTEYSTEVRELVISHHADGKSYRQIRDLLRMPLASVQYIIGKYKEHGIVGNLPRSGRPTLATPRTARLVVRSVLNNRRQSVEELKEYHALKLSASTVRNIIKDQNRHGRAARKKPRISAVNKKKRLNYARMYGDWTEEDWKSVLFTDESKFNLHDSDGRVYVWRRPGEEFNANCTVTTYKSGDKGFMVWGAIGWEGVSTLHFCTENVTAKYYVETLGEVLPEIVGMLGLENGFQFMQDNAPAHKAKLTTAFFDSSGIPTLDHPPQSPDLNPIEHVWDHVKREVRKIDPQTHEGLKEAIEHAWYNTPASVSQKLIGSMPRRLAAVVKNKGGPTKY